jgi:hypothetical protein
MGGIQFKDSSPGNAIYIFLILLKLCMKNRNLKRKVDQHEPLTPKRELLFNFFLFLTDVTHEKDERSTCQGQTA